MFAGTFTGSASASIPGFPGLAAQSFSHRGLLAIASASACSRPPLPTSSTRIRSGIAPTSSLAIGPQGYAEAPASAGPWAAESPFHDRRMVPGPLPPIADCRIPTPRPAHCPVPRPPPQSTSRHPTTQTDAKIISTHVYPTISRAFTPVTASSGNAQNGWSMFVI